MKFDGKWICAERNPPPCMCSRRSDAMKSLCHLPDASSPHLYLGDDTVCPQLPSPLSHHTPVWFRSICRHRETLGSHLGAAPEMLSQKAGHFSWGCESQAQQPPPREHTRGAGVTREAPPGRTIHLAAPPTSEREGAGHRVQLDRGTGQ